VTYDGNLRSSARGTIPQRRRDRWDKRQKSCGRWQPRPKRPETGAWGGRKAGGGPAGAAEGPAAVKKAAALYGGIGGKRLRAEMRGDGGTPARPQAGRGRRGRSPGARRAQKSIVSPRHRFLVKKAR